jgi:hypothetical protein
MVESAIAIDLNGTILFGQNWFIKRVRRDKNPASIPSFHRGNIFRDKKDA